MKTKRILNSLILITGVLAANLSYADQRLDEQSCTERDGNGEISDVLGEPRNQGNIGWCYANVAADLLTFRFKEELLGQRASAGYVAITFNQFAKAKPNQDAGLITPAVVFSQFYGLCPQEFQDYALKDSPFKTIREQINALVELKDAYNKLKLKGGTLDEIKVLEKYRNSKSILNKISDTDLIEILDKSSVANFPRRLVEKLCQPHLIKVKRDLKIRPQIGFVEGWLQVIPSIFKKRKYTPAPILGRENLIKEVHEELDKQNMIAIGYNTRIFYDPKSERYEKAGMHASSIVGRKWNPGNNTCELKLRNSWGKSCASYTNPALEGKCDPKTGYIMIPDVMLMQTITDVVYYHTEALK
jgi:hypothetical protein